MSASFSSTTRPSEAVMLEGDTLMAVLNPLVGKKCKRCEEPTASLSKRVEMLIKIIDGGSSDAAVSYFAEPLGVVRGRVSFDNDIRVYFSRDIAAFPIVLLFNPRGRNLVIQSPHEGTDNAGRLATCLFTECRARWMICNAVHPHSVRGKTKHDKCPTDGAHNVDSMFAIACHQILRENSHCMHIQVHGMRKAPTRLLYLTNQFNGEFTKKYRSAPLMLAKAIAREFSLEECNTFVLGTQTMTPSACPVLYSSMANSMIPMIPYVKNNFKECGAVFRNKRANMNSCVQAHLINGGGQIPVGKEDRGIFVHMEAGFLRDEHQGAQRSRMASAVVSALFEWDTSPLLRPVFKFEIGEDDSDEEDNAEHVDCDSEGDCNSGMDTDDDEYPNGWPPVEEEPLIVAPPSSPARRRPGPGKTDARARGASSPPRRPVTVPGQPVARRIFYDNGPPPPVVQKKQPRPAETDAEVGALKSAKRARRGLVAFAAEQKGAFQYSSILQMLELRLPTRRPNYAPPSPAIREAAAQVVRALARDDVSVPTWTKLLSSTGLRFKLFENDGHEIIALVPDDVDLFSASILFNPAADDGAPLILHAFHEGIDGTSRAASVLFAESGAKVCIVNAVHSKSSDVAPPGQGTRNISDASHCTDTLCHFLHVEFYKTYPRAMFLQLHGMGNGEDDVRNFYLTNQFNGNFAVKDGGKSVCSLLAQSLPSEFSQEECSKFMLCTDTVVPGSAFGLPLTSKTGYAEGKCVFRTHTKSAANTCVQAHHLNGGSQIYVGTRYKGNFGHCEMAYCFRNKFSKPNLLKLARCMQLAHKAWVLPAAQSRGGGGGGSDWEDDDLGYEGGCGDDDSCFDEN